MSVNREAMSPVGEDLRWNVQPEQFAVRVSVDDLAIMFKVDPAFDSGDLFKSEDSTLVKTAKIIEACWRLATSNVKRAGQVTNKVLGARQLIIEPGTQALVIDEGVYSGNLPPGTYTLQSFLERLQFQWRKQATAILTRMEDQVIKLKCYKIPTQENLFVDASLHITVQMAEVSVFLHNYMGANDTVDISKLQQDLAPLVRQALWSAIGKRSITDLTAPDVQQDLSQAVHDVLIGSFQRYGLSFTEVKMVDIKHEAFNKHRERQGELWLLGEGQQIASKTKLLELQKREEEIELDVLRQNIEADALEGRLAAVGRCHDAMVFLKSSEQDFKDQLLELDRRKVLRKEEADELLEGYYQRKEDRAWGREQAQRIVKLRQMQELISIREEMEHDVRRTKLEHEIELANRIATRDNEQWKIQLQRLQQEEQVKHEEQRLKLGRVAEAQQFRRDQDWEAMVHGQRMAGLRNGIEFERAEHASRVRFLEAELNTRLEAQKAQATRIRADAERAQKEWEFQFDGRKEDAKLDRLGRIQALNAESEERAARLKLELETTREDKTHVRELERLDKIATLGTEALIATSSTANAALLAHLKKQELSQDSEVTKRELENERELNRQRQGIYERLNDTERAKADAIAQAYREAMQSNQSTLHTMGEYLGRGFESMGQGSRSVAPATPPPPRSSAPRWHVGAAEQVMTESELVQAIQAGRLHRGTLVWREGMTEWAAICDVTALAVHLPAVPPPLPPRI